LQLSSREGKMTEEEDHFALFASWFFLLNWITFFLFSSSKESH